MAGVKERKRQQVCQVKYKRQKRNIAKKEEFIISGKELKDKIKHLLKEGNVRRIVIKNREDNVLMEIPVNFVVIGAVIAPVLAAVGAIAALLTDCKIVVERRE